MLTNLQFSLTGFWCLKHNLICQNIFLWLFHCIVEFHSNKRFHLLLLKDLKQSLFYHLCAKWQQFELLLFWFLIQILDQQNFWSLFVMLLDKWKRLRYLLLFVQVFYQPILIQFCFFQILILVFYQSMSPCYISFPCLIKMSHF